MEGDKGNNNRYDFLKKYFCSYATDIFQFLFAILLQEINKVILIIYKKG